MPIERSQLRAYAAVAVILVGSGVGSYLPARSARAALAERAAEARLETGVDTSKTSLKEVHEKVTELRLSSHESQRYIPPSDELADVLRGLTESLQAFGTTVHEVVVGDIQHHRDYSTIPLSLRFDGPFPAGYGVLKQIEAMNRLIRVERLRLDSDPTNPSAPVRVELEISTFFTPHEKGAGGT